MKSLQALIVCCALLLAAVPALAQSVPAAMNYRGS
jgi:putative cell wall-binding protein